MQERRARGHCFNDSATSITSRCSGAGNSHAHNAARALASAILTAPPSERVGMNFILCVDEMRRELAYYECYNTKSVFDTAAFKNATTTSPAVTPSDIACLPSRHLDCFTGDVRGHWRSKEEHCIRSFSWCTETSQRICRDFAS